MITVPIKMTSVQKQMLIEQAKKYNMKIDDLIVELIEENYNSKRKR